LENEGKKRKPEEEQSSGSEYEDGSENSVSDGQQSDETDNEDQDDHIVSIYITLFIIFVGLFIKILYPNPCSHLPSLEPHRSQKAGE